MGKIDVVNVVDDKSNPVLKDSGLEDDIDESIRTREKFINGFIDSTVSNYKSRWKTKRIYQHIITIILLLIVVLFAIADIVVIILVANGFIQNIGTVITLIASITTSFLSSIFSMLLIIVKYIFPSKEEENSMEVLKTTLLYNFRYIAQHNKNDTKENSQS